MTNLENQTLILVRDDATTSMWIDTWAVSYPVVRLIEVSGSVGVTQWRYKMDAVVASIDIEDNIVVVAHGVGVNAVLAWYYHIDILMQKRVKAVILVAPLQALFENDAQYINDSIRFHSPTALVIGTNDVLCPQDWAARQAEKWQARLFVSQYSGRLDTYLNGWQWGMKLMQEMLLR